MSLLCNYKYISLVLIASTNCKFISIDIVPMKDRVKVLYLEKLC
jgi:hypothetical protein